MFLTKVHQFSGENPLSMEGKERRDENEIGQQVQGSIGVQGRGRRG